MSADVAAKSPSEVSLTQTIIKLRKALEFYADKKNYKGGFDDDGDGYFDRHGYDILDDEGDVARAALGIEVEP